jgi:GTP pyrophosphokinase
MHNIAEFGVAAHWKYKDNMHQSIQPNLNWLHTLEINNENIEEFYDDTKQDLFSEEIVVYSPKGDIFTMPRGSTVYDFSYLVHTDIGYKANGCFVNTIKKSLLYELKSGDIINIILSNEIIPRCSWYDMVKTTKAKKKIKLLCQSRIKQIEELNGTNIINTIFSKYKYNILKFYPINKLDNISNNISYLKDAKKQIQNKIKQENNFLTRLRLLNMTLKKYVFDNINLYSNLSISSISFDHCCHPKQGDEIIVFKDKKIAIVHHKMCENAFNMMKENKQMIFCKWSDDKYFSYKMVLSVQQKRGELARLLNHLSNNKAIILSIDFRRDESSHIQYCTLDMQIKDNSLEKVKELVSIKAKIIECYSTIDAYK